MFLIIDNTQRKMRKIIKEEMMKKNIPCVVTDLNHADLYMPIPLVIVTEKYLYEDAVYIASFYGKSPVVVWDEKTDMITFALNKYKELYDIEFANSRIHHVVNINNEFTYCGKPFKLTPSEARIINFLQYSPGWYSRETIAAYCLKNGRKDKDAVNVHICNINNKSDKLIRIKVIDCRRFSGYRLKCQYKKST